MATIDLSKYPAPAVLEKLDYEAILAEMRALFVARFPADPVASAELGVPSQMEVELLFVAEGNLIVKALEAGAYYALQLRGRVNDAAKAMMLAHATGADLDNLAALYMVARLAGESDGELRTRLILAVDGFSTAGPIEAYRFHALSADADVKDVAVQSPSPGLVRVGVLARTGDGTPDATLLTAVQAALSTDDVRPLCDTVEVVAPSVISYAVSALIWVYPGVDGEIVRQAAEDACWEYARDTHRLGYAVTISGLHRALHQAGVQRVEIVSPAAEIMPTAFEAAYCTNVTVTNEGTDV